jgi:hypothetical protein
VKGLEKVLGRKAVPFSAADKGVYLFVLDKLIF